MNTARQLSERITERIENIPDDFRAIDKDALLNDIRNLYDTILDLEASSGTTTVSANEPVITQKKEPEPQAAVNSEPVAPVSKATKVVAKKEPSLVEVKESDPRQEVDSDEGTLAGKLNQKPITDLRSGIPLNEKFGFIQNLFQNNASDYGDAILKMNNANDQDEALSYFNKLTERKAWDMENAQVKSLRSYIERRHLMASEANADQ